MRVCDHKLWWLLEITCFLYIRKLYQMCVTATTGLKVLYYLKEIISRVTFLWLIEKRTVGKLNKYTFLLYDIIFFRELTSFHLGSQLQTSHWKHLHYMKLSYKELEILSQVFLCHFTKFHWKMYICNVWSRFVIARMRNSWPSFMKSIRLITNIRLDHEKYSLI